MVRSIVKGLELDITDVTIGYSQRRNPGPRNLWEKPEVY